MSRRALDVAGVVLASALFGVGCSSTSHDDGLKPYPHAEPESQGGGALYPAGPYGVNKGSIVDNFSFTGYADPSVDTAALVPIALADFYNETGDDVYPEGSPHGAGNPKPRALLIDVGSSWCGPCQQEASSVLPGKYAELAPRGAEFLFQLFDGPETGKNATEKDLKAWTKKFKSNYPSVIDPARQLAALFDPSAVPANFIIDTRTMELVELVIGAPSETFWSKFEATLDSGE